MQVERLAELAALRRDVQQFSRRRNRSIREFYDHDKGWFCLTLNDPERDSGKTVEHLTTTLTCLEALAESSPDDVELPILEEFSATEAVGDPLPPAKDDDAVGLLNWRRSVLRAYADKALKHPKDWLSDGAAYVYCRVRTLGALGRLIDPTDVVLSDNAANASLLLAQAWSSHESTPAFGLRESTKNPNDDEDLTSLSRIDPREAYVPNAFLTYWGLLALDTLPESVRPADWAAQQQAALEWLQKSLAQQVSFHFNGSGNADPQQLAWSICAHVRFASEDQIVAKTTVAHTQLEAGLQAFFAQQSPNGDWPKGQPLFFYPHAGNAYCYPYETLAELLSLAATRGRRYAVLRDALLPYFEKLRDLYRLAEHTRQPLKGDDAWGWSSGHNPRRIAPEAWATASVYRFAEGFRRLLGAWTNQEAQRLLEARRPEGGLDELRTRGATWNVGRGSAGAQLATGFLNPIRRFEKSRLAHTATELDPDLPVVPKGGATSAILFGPPGTGKTTLVEALAGALDWPFIEITPAQFLDRGLEMVSARADEIFRQVMQLNRCVVLLDEIDELTRIRADEAEPVERFFTTTMLPRIAKLWKSKRILFFVNTNDILHVDPAIRRSQRFDAAIFVLPPGFDAKVELLGRHKPPIELTDLTPETVTAELLRTAADGDGPPDTKLLAWFALLRFDQLDRFADDLHQATGSDQAAAADVVQTLPPFVKELLALDWHAAKGEEQPPDGPPIGLHELLNAQRRDPAVRPLAVVGAKLEELRGDSYKQGDFVEIPAHEDDPEAWALQNELRLRSDGVLEPPPTQ